MLKMTAVRREKELSMSALARKAEMHVSSISQIEHGRLVPYLVQKEKIAGALDWTGDIDDLFENVEEA